MRWNEVESDELINKLMDIFERKLAFTMQQGKAAQSLAERVEQNKTDLEYAKLSGLLKTDSDKLAFEERKMNAGFKYGFDLETLKNNGLLDVERLKSATDLQKAKMVKDAAMYGHDVDLNKGIFSASHTVRKDAEGNTTSAYDPRANAAILATQASSPDPAAIRTHGDNIKAKLASSNPTEATNYFNALDPVIQQGVKRTLGMGNAQPAAAPAPGAGIFDVQLRNPINPITPEEDARRKLNNLGLTPTF